MRALSIALGAALVAALAYVLLDPAGPRTGGLERSTPAVRTIDAGVAELSEVALEGARVDADGSRADDESAAQGGDATALDPTGLSGDASLTVNVRWSDDTPAVGVFIIVRTTRESHGVYDHYRRPTGDAGSAVFESIPPGALHLCTDRTGWDPVEQFSLAPGEARELTLTLPIGLQVAGRVLDEDGAPVADADIWMTSATGGWTSGGVVTRSDGGGNFGLRDVPARPSLGALARGFRPSALVDLELQDHATSPVHVLLRVARGGAALEGTVTDAAGLALAGAIVALGANDGSYDTRADESVIEEWQVRAVETDDEGRYRFGALEPGEVTVRVRAPRDHEPWLAVSSTTVTLTEGETQRCDVALSAACVVTGTVTAVDGAPVAGATVMAFDRPLDESFLQSGQVDDDSPFSYAATRSREDGTYRLERVPTGVVHLYAQEPRPSRARMQAVVRFTRGSFELAPGAIQVWDPVLSDGLVIAGRALYRDGAPLTGMFISVTRGDGVHDHRAVHSEDGTFRFVQLADAAYDVRVQIWQLPPGAREPSALGVRPGGEPIELVATFDAPIEYEPSTLRLRLVDTAQRAGPGGSLGVLLKAERRRGWRIPDLKDDVWTFSLDEPDRYRVVGMFAERVVFTSDWIDIAEGTHTDLGTLATKSGGDLVVRIVPPPEVAPEELQVTLRLDACERSETIPFAPGARELRIAGVQPGPCRLTIYAANTVPVERNAVVVAGAAVEVEATLAAAVRVPYEIAYPSSVDVGALTVRFTRRSDGEVVKEVHIADLARYQNPIRWSALFEPGEYTFEASLAKGRAARQDFDITSLDAENVPSVGADLR